MSPVSAVAVFVSPTGKSTAASTATVTKDHSLHRLNLRLIVPLRSTPDSHPDLGREDSSARLGVWVPTHSPGWFTRRRLDRVGEDRGRAVRLGDDDRHGWPD